jgi:hypothetical protein
MLFTRQQISRPESCYRRSFVRMRVQGGLAALIGTDVARMMQALTGVR